jgi:DNA polymerase III subunit beta
MKLNLERETLLKPLQQVIGVVDRKQTLPILSNVLIDAKDNKISITGTDLEVELVGHTILDTPQESGRITLPGRKLMDICRALPDNAPIELYQEKEKAILKSGRSRFTLTTLPSEDFPSIETQAAAQSFSLPQSELKTLLQRTVFAMAQQDVRYYLNGMLFELSNNQLRAIATDGHRMALNTAMISIDLANKKQIIIPRKGVVELLRILEDNESNVTVTIGTNHVRIEGDTGIFTSKLIDGRFPDYQRVIPKSGDKITEVDKDTLKAALSRTAILCNEKFRGVRFELRNDLLRILANNPDQEAAEDELQINYNRGDLDIGFNVNYLLDILHVFGPGAVRLTFIDSNSSMLVEEAGNESNSLFVVMPMRL